MRCPRVGSQRGFALLIALWLLVPVALLFVILSGVARSDAQLTSNLRTGSALAAAADGAINTAIFELMQRRAPAETPPSLAVRIGAAEIGVAIENQSGLVNPNLASPELLRALLMRLGLQPDRAGSLAAAMVDWRTPGQRARPNGARTAEYRAAGLGYGPPGAPFETIGEVGQVLGMTPALMASLAPYLTLYTDADPDTRYAAPLVRAALSDLGRNVRSGGGGNDVVRITAAARDATGAQVVRRAVIRIGFSGNRRGWRVLDWDAPPPG
ncbi:MAG: type II secretion system protein GspK [Acetobacteraceae bacterium]